MMRDDRGTVSIEFAFLAPVLFMTIGGLIEYGRIVAAQQATRDIIDGAARAGVVQVLSSTAVQDIITGALDYVIDVEDGTSLAITVTATYNVAFAGLLPTDVVTFQMSTTLHR
jgi:Flp pilus assembly protein TadG